VALHQPTDITSSHRNSYPRSDRWVTHCEGWAGTLVLGVTIAAARLRSHPHSEERSNQTSASP
jgi:hypothetical protein